MASTFKYEKVRVLKYGSGGSQTSVYRWLSDETLKAGKEVVTNLYPNWKKEFDILKDVANVGHPNIVQYFTAEKQEHSVIFLMELCDCNLEQYVSNECLVPATSENELKKVKPKDYFDISPLDVCKQVVRGIHYLHKYHGLIHRDIKPANILLVQKNGKTKVKVADFGLSRILPEGQSSVLTGSTSTGVYMAPETHKSIWKRSSDIFSLGILMCYVLSNGHHPFGDKDYKQKGNICEMISPCLDCLRNTKINLSKEQKVTAADLVKGMLRHEPDERLTIEEVLCHPTFWNSKKKVDFYKEVKQYIYSKQGEKFVLQLNIYDSRLLSDDDSKGLTKFDISLENIPPAVRKANNSKFSITKCGNIKELLRIIRNLATHILEDAWSAEARKSIGATRQSVNWDVFLEKLTGSYPQLLVHIYEFFRGRKVFEEYYTSSSSVDDDDPSTVRGETPTSATANQSIVAPHSNTNSASTSSGILFIWDDFEYD